MFDESRGEEADLPAGKREAIIFEKSLTDFFALTVVKKALASNMDLQVIAVDGPWSHLTGQELRTLKGPLPGWLSTIGGARAHDLFGHESSMSERDDVALDGLQKEGRPCATGARVVFRQSRNRQAGSTRNQAAIFDLDQTQVRPQCGERGERAPFFSPSL